MCHPTKISVAPEFVLVDVLGVCSLQSRLVPLAFAANLRTDEGQAGREAINGPTVDYFRLADHPFTTLRNSARNPKSETSSEHGATPAIRCLFASTYGRRETTSVPFLWRRVMAGLAPRCRVRPERCKGVVKVKRNRVTPAGACGTPVHSSVTRSRFDPPRPYSRHQKLQLGFPAGSSVRNGPPT
jgi:hypothetical protein